MRKKVKILTVLLFVNLAIIWGNSLLPGSISGNISDFAKGIIKEIFVFLPDSGVQSGGVPIRKLGHFAEFMCFGILLHTRYVSIKLWKSDSKYYREIKNQINSKDLILSVILPGFMTAFIDETIQLFVPDRCGLIIDVWIDTSGMLTGFLITLILFLLKKSK